jgi:hypothetical protein
VTHLVTGIIIIITATTTIVTIIIATADEASTFDPGIAGSCARQAQLERGGALALGTRRQTDKAAAEKISRGPAAGN